MSGPQQAAQIPNTVVQPWRDPLGKEHPNYQCTCCQYSTLDAQAMREHQFHEDHLWPWPEGENPYQQGE